MAIAHDATSTADDRIATSLSFNHTCSGSERALIVVAGGQSADVGDITGVTYNAVSLTNWWDVSANNFLGSTGWHLVAPATGINSCVVTYSGATDYLRAIANSFTGVDQSTPVGAASTQSGWLTDPSLDVAAGSTEDLVIDGLFTDDDPLTVGSGQTLRGYVDADSYRYLGCSTKPGLDGNVAMGWTATSGWKSQGGGALKSSGGGTTSVQLDSSSRVFTRGDLASAHHLKGVDQLASAFNVMAAAIVDNGYRVKTVDVQTSAYNLISGQVLGSSWAVFSGKQLDSSWNVLASGYLASLASAFNIAGIKNQASEYHIKSQADAQSGYRVFTTEQADSLWRVIRSDAMSAAYHILTSKSMDHSSAVRAAATVLAGARVLALVDQQFAYAVGNLVAVLSSAWEVHSDIVILPLSTHAANSIVFDHQALPIEFDRRAYAIRFSQEVK